MSARAAPVSAPSTTPTVAERQASGAALRVAVPRSSHAQWSPRPDRPDPVALLQDSDRARLADLTPVRYGRMVASPFAFLRGAAVVMAHDLAATPRTGLTTQVCGDAHVGNFGAYASPERTTVFDLNDFDETLSGPWEWDVKRLATSIVVAGRQNGLTRTGCHETALSCVRSYRQHMAGFADLPNLDLWYYRLDAQRLLARARHYRGAVTADLNQALQKAQRSTSRGVFPKLAARVAGQYRIADDPPLITHVADDTLTEWVPRAVETYLASVRDEQHVLLNRYRVADVARKVVGVGSVGTRCFVVLLLGKDDTDPLFLQVKEAQPSVLERYAGASPYPNCAQRVVTGQRLMQAASDIFLGWSRVDGVDYYVRQLRDRKYSPVVAAMDNMALNAYADLCGWALARAHARAGDAAQISGYLGKSPVFDDAIASFAEAYADQTERDHSVLVAAVKSGRVRADTGV